MPLLLILQARLPAGFPAGTENLAGRPATPVVPDGCPFPRPFDDAPGRCVRVPWGALQEARAFRRRAGDRRDDELDSDDQRQVRSGC